ncbi:MAG: protein phosphatase 2C domain-containing protein [Deltaproteobacteria bacterium]|nr:protein phosphatase 2C domain-containing protein [Deltaproteobacteria bacterium]
MSAWRTASAVVIGSDHGRMGLPCQDRAVVRVVELQDALDRLVMVACDGAGSASHAELGAEVASQAAAAFLAAMAPITDTTDAGAAGASLLGRVRDALTVAAAEAGVPFKMLATTLLAVAVDRDHALAFQVGDGAIVLTTEREPRTSLAFWPVKGAHANETWFATSDNAFAQLQGARIDATALEVAVLTDGLEHLALDFAAKVPHAAFFGPFFAAVGELSPGDLAASAALSAELEAFLASPRVLAETGDDKTLLLAVRTRRDGASLPAEPSQDAPAETSTAV